MKPSRPAGVSQAGPARAARRQAWYARAMTKRHLVIDPDVRSASTLPSEIYADPASYRLQVERVMARSWHLVSAVDPVPDPATAAPLTLLPGCGHLLPLEEPVAFGQVLERWLERCKKIG